jgi:hypothetical protein
MSDPDGACYKCGETETALGADGRGLYNCDQCGQACCSMDSENGEANTVFCLECWRDMDQDEGTL